MVQASGADSRRILHLTAYIGHLSKQQRTHKSGHQIAVTICVGNMEFHRRIEIEIRMSLGTAGIVSLKQMDETSHL